MKRVLIGVLKTDEREFDSCLASIDRQSFRGTETFVIENLPNKQAHDVLYERFMSRAAEFDVFLKFDADMVFARDDVLAAMVDEFRPGIAHLMTYVKDGPSGLMIPGVQMFRSDSRWMGSQEQVNVDYVPEIQGKGLTLIDKDYVHHMPDPSNFQLFRYGIHKAIKAIQPDRANKNMVKAMFHATILAAIARRHQQGEARLVWALISSMLVCLGQLKGVDYNSPDNRDFFEALELDQVKFEALSRDAGTFWGHEILTWQRWLELFGKARW
jgi:hypothetical protein